MTTSKRAGMASVILAIIATTVISPPATADGGPVPPEQRLIVNPSVTQNPNAELVAGAAFLFSHLNGSAPEAGTAVMVTVTSCGDFIAAASGSLEDHPGLVDWFTPDGGIDLGPNPTNAKVGPSFDYAITVTEPGFDSYQLGGTVTGYSVHRPSCATLHEPEVTVKRWSRIRGRAIVGHVLTATPTVAPGCHVSYTWKAGSGPVARGRRLVVKPKWRYFSLSLVVKVTRPGYRTLSRKILAHS